MLKGLQQRLTAGIGIEYCKIAIQQQDGGDAADTEFAGIGAAEFLFVAEQDPIKTLFLDIFKRQIDRFIEADADNHKAFVFVAFLGFFNVGSFSNTRPAPGGPEVDENHFAAKILQIEDVTIDCLAGDVGDFIAFFELAAFTFSGAAMLVWMPTTNKSAISSESVFFMIFLGFENSLACPGFFMDLRLSQLVWYFQIFQRAGSGTGNDYVNYGTFATEICQKNIAEAVFIWRFETIK